MELILATFSALFSVVNPFGAMPLFLTLTQDDSTPQRKAQALKACMFMVIILGVFFLTGQYVLNFFGLRIHDLRIAGGIMIMRAGFELLNTKSGEGKKIGQDVVEEGIQKDDISFTPMAMPMLSGPGSIAIVISMFSRNLSLIDIGLILFSIGLLAVPTYFILAFSPKLYRFLGKAGLAALTRMMGFITLSIGVSLIITALLALFKN